jgi:hypothetical protein
MKLSVNFVLLIANNYCCVKMIRVLICVLKHITSA